MVPNVKSQTTGKKVRKIVMMHICVFAGLVLLMGTVWHCPVQLPVWGALSGVRYYKGVPFAA
mgnify:CR=1 FL=1